jgi:hypothetical protein
MTSIRKVALACVASALIALPLTATAQTGPRNQDTFFTFSQPVELPGKTLPAGTYFFQLMDSDSNRHIVKVMSQDRKELHATLLAIPYYTNDRPSDEPQVRFMETPAGGDGSTTAANAGTNAIKVWFYPGRTVGHEFIYPRSQAMRIASRSGDSVLTTKTDTPEVAETVADSELTRVDRSGADAAVDMSNRAQTEQSQTAQTQTAQTQTAETETRTAQTQPQTTQTQTETRTAQTEPAPAPQPRTQPMTDRTTDTAATREARTELPATASLLPLLAIIGVGSLVGSRMLRRGRRV